jgi:hypothetical protein
VFNKIFKVFERYAETCLKIKNKPGEIVPFILNNAQKKVLTAYYKAREEDKLLRFIILKARQEGVSTLWEGIIYQRTKNQFNRKAQIVGHENDACNNLFDMFKRFHDYDEAQAEVEHSNEKKLSFKTLKSEIKVKSAEGRENVKRSDTIQDLHATEVAFWADAKASMNALLQTVPDQKNTLVVIESTANGIGGWFYDTWQDAMNGDNDYIPIFLAWFDLPEYTKDFENTTQKENLLKSIDEYEISLLKNYNLVPEQLNWRRYTIANKCGGDLDLFKQEYPSTPEEAFIISGRPVFDATICLKKLNGCKEPLSTGFLHPIYNNTEEYRKIKLEGGSYYDLKKFMIGVEWEENPRGYIKLYEEIQYDENEHGVYVGGCDVAEGLEQGDFSYMPYMDRRTNKDVLIWHGHIDPDLLAEEQHKIQWFLGSKCTVNTEMNNNGLTTINTAYQLGVRQYYREDFKKGYVANKSQLGTRTTTQTKPFMINDLNENIRESLWECNEKEFWGECLTFVRDSHGAMGAQGKLSDPGTKCFDDRVMGQALKFRCHIWMSNYHKVVKVEEIITGRAAVSRENQVKETTF